MHSVSVHVFPYLCVLSVQSPSLVDMLHRIDELDVIPQLQVIGCIHPLTYMYMYMHVQCNTVVLCTYMYTHKQTLGYVYTEKPVKQEKHFVEMYKDVEIAMQETIETRCRYGSTQARQG